MTIREARCARGALPARAEGDPVRLPVCHCLDCKRRRFCPQCGDTVFSEIERRPGMISIPAGTFADPAFPSPTEVYDERRCPWLPDFGIPREV